MCTKLIACVIFVLPVAGAAASLAPASGQYSAEGAAPVESPFSRPALGQADITLRNGTVLRNARVRSISGDRATVLHAGGLTSVAVADLPEELRPRQAAAQPSEDIVESFHKSVRQIDVTRSVGMTGGQANLRLYYNHDRDLVFGFSSFLTGPKLQSRAIIIFDDDEIGKVREAAETYFRWASQAVQKNVSVVTRPLAELRRGQMEFRFTEEAGAFIYYRSSILVLEDVDALRALVAKENIIGMADEMRDKVNRVRAGLEMK